MAQLHVDTSVDLPQSLLTDSASDIAFLQINLFWFIIILDFGRLSFMKSGLWVSDNLQTRMQHWLNLSWIYVSVWIWSQRALMRTSGATRYFMFLCTWRRCTETRATSHLYLFVMCRHYYSQCNPSAAGIRCNATKAINSISWISEINLHVII